MSLVTGRNEARLDEAAHQIRRAAPRVKVETIVANLSTRSGVSALIAHVGERPIEVGPCGMMDRMGLGVVYHVAKLLGETPHTQALEYARYIDEHFIQKGRLGVATGEGFYSYPNPAFAQPGFISPARHRA
jgi:3-hydroxyacyl-CoA dehydrogenase